MPATKTRVIGSGYTTIEYNGKPIAFLQSFTDTGQFSLGPGAAPAGGAGASEAIYVLGQNRAVEIAVGRVLAVGSITASIRELWNEPVWYQLSGLRGRRTITDVWEALRRSPAPVTCRMLIRPPQGAGPIRGKIYHGCVVTGIDDNETVTIGALTVAKDVVIAYTHTTPV